MVTRLVLGCTGVGRAVLDALDRQLGDLTVVTDDRSRVESLREEGISATHGDPADPETYPESASVVLVGCADADRTRRIVDRVREAFPSAHLVAYVDADAPADAREALDARVDAVLDPVEAFATRALDVAASERGRRAHRLLRVLREVDGRLAVVMHDNPDPDAIASALALSRIAASVGVPADACYFGDISHQENRALVNLLDIELLDLDPEFDRDAYAGYALVDHSRPGVNDGLPEDLSVDVVIDHHPPRAPVEGRFLDLRSDVGATSTLLVEYLNALDVDPGETVATSLLFGIRVDTDDFTREVSVADFEAAASLLPSVDHSVLERVETPSMSSDVLDTLARAIQNREVRDTALATNVGKIRDRDALAQAADRLLDMEGIRIVLVYGYADDVVYVSGRARGTSVDLGETLRDALGAIGSAGGHADMAGAQLPLGILSDLSEESAAARDEIIHDVVAGRFFETLEDIPTQQPDTSAADISFEYPLGEE